MLSALNTLSGLSVNDIKRARAFYVDTLGLTLNDDNMGLYLELPGGGELFIYEKQNHTPATYTALNFVVASIDDTVDHLASHGITFEHYDNIPAQQDEKEILRGKRAQQGPDIAWFKDPAGNILAVVEE
ncbi:MAG: Glyoxalase-like domain protein [Candidatus Saccharibacteria bacterium]|jgi:catechol 2,3-dioxygenase-like lactoylglutathione lyase family enzyme|nr:Glyoxalase-like domain protein [Candidatus Saccharibacteria bacterium]